MSDSALINTQDVQKEVKVVTDALDKLSQEIKNLDGRKVTSITKEFEKLSKSSNASVKEMVDNLKHGLDNMLQAQQQGDAARLREAKVMFAALAMGESQFYKDSLAKQKAADDAKAAAAATAAAKALAERKAAADARAALDAAAEAKPAAGRAGRAVNDARELAILEKSIQNLKLNVKYAADLEVARQQIIDAGSSTMLTSLKRREAQVRRLLETGSEVALASAKKTYGSDFVSVVQAGLTKETETLAKHAETTLALKRAQHEAMILAGRAAAAKVHTALEADLLKDELAYQAHQAKIVTDKEAAMSKLWAAEKAARATARAGLEADLLKDELIYQAHHAKLVSDKEAAMSKLWAAEKAARASARAMAAKAQVKAATLTAVGDYSSLASGRLMRIKNAETFMNMPSKEDYLAAAAKAAQDASAWAMAAKAKVKAATLTAVGDYSSLASGRLMRIKNAETFMNMPSKEDYLAAAAKAAAEAAAATAAARAQVAAATNSATGQYQRYNPNTGAAGSLITPNAVHQTDALGAAFGRLGVKSSTLHSLVRGLASGFNLLWLTYGSTAPLIAGALVSAGFVSAIKQGAEFAEKLFVIRELAGATAAQVQELAHVAMEMGTKSQFGPLQVAEALKVLSLAGLTAEKALTALAPTLQFAAAGGVRTEDAAATLVAVATAYRYSADNFGVVGDLIAKTAADTQASVSDMSEAFKMSSVLAQQYGTTLDDTAAAIGMLAQIGIKGSSAGTAWRNMIVEFNKGSGKAAQGIRDMGVELEDFEGNSRSIMDVMKDLSSGLILLTSKAQTRVLQDITNERGAKAVAAFQAQLLAHLNKSNPLLQEQVDYLHKAGKAEEARKLATDAVAASYAQMTAEMEASANSSPNFSFLADLEGQFTPLKVLQGIVASLSAALVKAFEDSEGALLSLGLSLRESFNSETFTNSVSSMVSGVVTAITFMKDTTVAAVEATVWALDHLAMTAALALGAYASYALGAAAVTAALPALATAASLVVVPIVALAGAIGASVGGFLAIVAAIGLSIYVMYDLVTANNDLAESAEESAERQKEAAKDAAEAAADEAKKAIKGAEAIMESQWQQLTERTDQQLIEMDAYNKNKDLQLQINAELRASFEEKQKGNTKAAEAHAKRADELQGQMVSSEETAVRAQGEAMKARINQWASYQRKVIEVAHEVKTLDKIIAAVSFGKSIAGLEAAAQAAKAKALKDLEAERSGRLGEVDAEMAKQVELGKLRKANAEADAKAAGNRPTGYDDSKGYKSPKGFSRGASYDNPAKKAAEEAAKLIAAGKELAEGLLAQSGGLSDDFAKKWDSLGAAYKAGAINLDKLTAAQAVLLSQQPAMKAIQDDLDKSKKAREDSLKSATDSVDKLVEEHAALELSREKNINLAEAVEMLKISRLQEAVTQHAVGSEAWVTVMKEIAARKELLKLLPTEAIRAKEKSEWESVWKSVDDTAHSAFLKIMDSGESLFVQLRDTLKKTLLDLLYRMTVKKWLLNVTAVVTGSSTGLAQAGVASGGSGSATDVLSSLKSLFSAGSGGNGMGFAGTVSGGLASAAESLGNAGFNTLANSALDAANTVLKFKDAINIGGDILGYATAAYSLSEGKYVTAVGQAVGTYFGGPLGAFIGGKIGGWVDKAIGWGGETRSGATYVTGADGKAQYQQGPSGGQIAGATAREMFDAAQSSIKAALLAMGAKSVLTGYTAGLESSKNDKGFAFAGGYINGKGFGEHLGRDGGQFDMKSQDGQEAFAAYELQLKQSIIEALQVADDIPETIKRIINDGLEGRRLRDLGSEDVVKMLDTINTVVVSVNGFNAAILKLPFENLKNMGFDAAAALITTAKGLDALSAGLTTYYDNFYSEEEKRLQTIKAINAATAGSGFDAATATKESFRALVEAQDVTTESGRKTYVALLGVSEAFASVTEVMQTLQQDTANLQIELLRAKGDIAGANAAQRTLDTTGYNSAELAVYDYNASLRAQIDALSAGGTATEKLTDRIATARTDLIDAYQREVDAMQSVVDKFRGFARDLRAFRDSLLLGALSPLTPGQRYAEASKQFEKTLAAAMAGDETAMGELEGISTAFLEASKTYNASSAAYVADFARVQDALTASANSASAVADVAQLQLDAAKSQLAALGEIDKSVISVAQSVENLAAAVLAAVAAGVNPGVDSIADLTGGVKDAWVGSAYSSAAGAGALRTDAGISISTPDGRMFTGDDAVQAVNEMLSAGDRRGVYDAAKAAGISLASLDQLMSWEPMTAEAWAIANGLPLFKDGTNFVGADTLAFLHQGEAVVPRAYNPAAGGKQGPSDGALLTEIRLLRDEIRQHRQQQSGETGAVVTAIHVAAAKNADTISEQRSKAAWSSSHQKAIV